MVLTEHKLLVLGCNLAMNAAVCMTIELEGQKTVNLCY